VGYNLVAEIRVYLHSFNRCRHQNLSAKSREIPTYCSSRPSKVIDLDVSDAANRKRTHNFLLVISNVGLMLYSFRDIVA